MAHAGNGKVTALPAQSLPSLAKGTTPPGKTNPNTQDSDPYGTEANVISWATVCPAELKGIDNLEVLPIKGYKLGMMSEHH